MTGWEVWVTGLQGWDGGTGVEAADVQRKIGHGMLLPTPARRTGLPSPQGNHHREGSAHSRTRLPGSPHPCSGTVSWVRLPNPTTASPPVGVPNRWRPNEYLGAYVPASSSPPCLGAMALRARRH